MTAGLPGALKRPARVYRSTLAAILIVSIAAAPVRAQDATPDAPEAPTPARVDQVIYKGVVGNLLEAVPLQPEQRLQLQRGNAIVSNALTGRSLAILLGLASPVLIVGGLIWGLWAASNIKAAPPAAVALAPQANEATEIAQAPAAVENASAVASPEERASESAESAHP